MADKDLIIRERLDHSGLFDFPAFYSFAHNWFKEEGYIVTEDRYIENISGNARNIIIEWTATRKISDYFKMEHKVKMEIKNLTDVEVEIDGQKKKMNRGGISIDHKGGLISDVDSKWDKSPFFKFFKGIYNKYIIQGRIDSMEDRVAYDTRTFKEEAKALLVTDMSVYCRVSTRSCRDLSRFCRDISGGIVLLISWGCGL